MVLTSREKLIYIYATLHTNNSMATADLKFSGEEIVNMLTNFNRCFETELTITEIKSLLNDCFNFQDEAGKIMNHANINIFKKVI